MALKYKNFTWPTDPSVYREELYREPRYTTQNGTPAYSSMGATQRRITGSGAFFGTAAYEHFRDLLELAEDNSPGTLIHPLWGSRHCYLTRLELNQEPRENFISYSFEFIQAKSDGTIPK